MSPSERVYGILLRAYPAAFRAEFGREMAQAFRDRRRERFGAPIGFWLFLLNDLARSAIAMRVDDLRATTKNFIREGKMKTMAILTILVGVLEVLNSALEAWLGGIVLHDGVSLVDASLGILAGAALVAAAIAMLRRKPRAAALAQGAAIACLVVFAAMTLISQRFSVFATILGICFPIVLLIYFRVTGGRGPSLPHAA